MKISNFKYTESNSYEFLYATIDIETGHLFWKKVTTEKIFKRRLHWAFVKNGEFTPGRAVENLENALKAQSALLN